MLHVRSTLTYAYGFVAGILISALIVAVSYAVSEHTCTQIVNAELEDKIIIPASAFDRRP